MQKNIGMVDQYLRLFSGLVALTTATKMRKNNLASAVLMTYGAMKVTEGVTGWCPLLHLAGATDTAERSQNTGSNNGSKSSNSSSHDGSNSQSGDSNNGAHSRSGGSDNGSNSQSGGPRGESGDRSTHGHQKDDKQKSSAASGSNDTKSDTTDQSKANDGASSEHAS